MCSSVSHVTGTSHVPFLRKLLPTMAETPKKKQIIRAWKIISPLDDPDAYELVDRSPRDDSNHFVHNHLCRMPNFIERYDLYQPRWAKESTCGTVTDFSAEGSSVLVAVIHVGPNLEGYPRVIHGGATALLFDDVVGFATDVTLALERKERNAVTAHLAVDFIMGLPVPSTVFMTVRLLPDLQDGRKLWFLSQMINPEQTVVYAQAKVLYMLPRASL